MTDSPVRCPVCGAQSRISGRAPDWGDWRTCEACTLEFVDPMRLPEPPMALYDSAYRGKRSENDMQEFHFRVAQRRSIIMAPRLWFWTPAFDMILNWLQTSLKPGATVFEIGCGLGFVLHELRNQGFNAMGLDVAKTAVDLNVQDGFRVWHGTIDTLPEAWGPAPDAVLAFFLLQHLENPLAMFKEVRRRWPTASFAVAQYLTGNELESGNPPRSLTHWNPKALRKALELAGYRCEVMAVRSAGFEHPIFQPAAAVFRRLVVFPPVFRLGRRIQRNYLSRLAARLPNAEKVVVGLATPIAQESGLERQADVATASG